MTMFHIILIEFDFNSFTATCDFNIEACSSKRKIFMDWNVWNEWYNGKEQVEQPFVGH